MPAWTNHEILFQVTSSANIAKGVGLGLGVAACVWVLYFLSGVVKRRRTMAFLRRAAEASR